MARKDKMFAVSPFASEGGRRGMDISLNDPLLDKTDVYGNRLKFIYEQGGALTPAQQDYYQRLQNQLPMYGSVTPSVSSDPSVTPFPIGCPTGFYQQGNVCFPAGYPIITSNGLKPIESIKKGDHVYTHKGRFRPVTETFSRYYSGDVIGVRTYGSSFRTVTTPNHPYLLDNDQWFSADKLEIGSMIKLARPSITNDIESVCMAYTKRIIVDGSGNQVVDSVTGRLNARGVGNITSVKKSETITMKLGEDLLTVIGYYLAEGYAYRNYRHPNVDEVYGVQFTFGSSEKEYKLAIDLAARLKTLGLRPGIKLRKYGWMVTCYSIPLSMWLVSEFGKGAANKRIPQWVIELPENKIKYILESYIAGDGYKERKLKDYYTTASISLSLAIGVYLCSIKCGYVSSIKKKQGGQIIQGRNVNAKPIFHVSINRSLVRKQHQGKMRSAIGHIAQRIRDIQREYFSGPVYNLEVEEDNSYCSLTHTVHNCIPVVGTYPGEDDFAPPAGQNFAKGQFYQVDAPQSTTRGQLFNTASYFRNVGAIRGKFFIKWKIPELGIVDSLSTGIWVPQFSNGVIYKNIMMPTNAPSGQVVSASVELLHLDETSNQMVVDDVTTAQIPTPGSVPPTTPPPQQQDCYVIGGINYCLATTPSAGCIQILGRYYCPSGGTPTPPSGNAVLVLSPTGSVNDGSTITIKGSDFGQFEVVDIKFEAITFSTPKPEWNNRRYVLDTTSQSDFSGKFTKLIQAPTLSSGVSANATIKATGRTSAKTVSQAISIV